MMARVSASITGGYIAPFRSLPSARVLMILPPSWRHSGDGNHRRPGVGTDLETVLIERLKATVCLTSISLSAIFVFPSKCKGFSKFLDRACWLLLAPKARFWELAGTILGTVRRHAGRDL